MQEYQKWIGNDYFDKQTTDELLSIADDKHEIEERFYKSLDFGTAGMRGKLGAGTNRMNVYMIRRATKGFGNYILENGDKDRGVVIAYDSRNFSDVFALETAKTLAGMGIKAYLFTSLRPVPVLSYGIRKLNAQAGVAITASHNPKEYNGYKVYWDDGAQAVDEVADEIISCVNAITDYDRIQVMEEKTAVDAGLIEYIDSEIDDAYTDDIKTLSCCKDFERHLKIVFTPIHGAGNIPVRRVLSELGYDEIVVVKEQEQPDGDFPTVSAPNPEDEKAFDIAVKYAKQCGAELIIGTDPDSDRLGILILDNDGKFYRPNGNEIGALLFDFYIKANSERLTNNDVMIKSIVSSDIVKKIASDHNIKVVEVLTGFKYIGEYIKNIEGTDENFVFGFEESYGYLAGTFVRDKDAVVAAMLTCDMCAYYKRKGKKVYDVLMDLYEKYGYFSESQLAITLEGKAGMERISRIMDRFRKDGFPDIPALILDKKYDYQHQTIEDAKTGAVTSTGLRESNVLKYVYDNSSWVCLRPSGTEPKIKVYGSACEKTKQASKAKLDEMIDIMKKMIDTIE
jgi:phosphoglucomutase